MDEFPKDYISKGAVEYVYTTHVKHQEHFFIHLDSQSSILEDIMEALENRYTHLPPMTKVLQNVKLGSLCAAKFTDDDNWYRAKVTGIIQNGLVEVQFVDFGNIDYVTKDRVKILDPDLVQYPVQSYRCALAGVSCEHGFWPPELMVQFEDLVIDKRCKAVFQGKREGDEVYLIDMYDEEGNYLNKMFSFGDSNSNNSRDIQAAGDMPKGHKDPVNQNGNETPGFETLSWKVGDKVQASVVYVKNPNQFWCQDVAFLNNIIILSEELSRLHMTQEMKPLDNIQRGAICAAKFDEDEAWYRGIIKNVSQNSASVFFVDYGNTENVNLDSICDLKDNFKDLPALATKCSLANVKMGGKAWAQDTVNEFENFVMDKEFEVKVVGKQGLLYEVTLLDVEENKDIGNQLQQVINQQGAKAQTPPKEKKSGPLKSSSSGVDLPVGSVCNVFLSWVDNPGDFWVQRAEDADLVDKLSADLQEFYAQPRPGAMSARGAFVIARFSEDRLWYRALVVKEMDDCVKVLFIDYGNTDTISKEELRQVSPQFGEVDPLAFQCSLDNLKPLRQDNTWSVDAKHFLEDLTENGCQCEVIRKSEACRIVKLTADGKDVAKELVSLAVVTDARQLQSKPSLPCYNATIKLQPNQSENVTVAHVDSPHSLWVQLSKNTSQLDALMDKLESHYSEDGGTPLSRPASGQPCVAQYGADNAWYRALVLSASSAGCEVQFIDYGNIEVVSPNLVCVPEPRFLDLPPQAVQCSLSLPGNQQQLTDSLTDMILEKELKMQVLSLNGTKAVVELMENEHSITDLLKKQVASGTGTVKLTPAKNIPLSSPVNAYVSVALSPNKFFIQLAGIDDELASLMSQITSLYAQESIPIIQNPVVGSFCVALYHEDNQWYRGKITAVQGSQCSILFVDYGNEELISNNFIKELSPEISNVPILAYECSLDGVSCEAWTETAIECFESLVIEKELSCTFTDRKLVHIMCNGENIAEKLISLGHGKSSKVIASPPRGSDMSWKDNKISPSAGRTSGWGDKPVQKSGLDKSPRKAFGESGGFAGRRDNEGFSGGRKKDFGNTSDQDSKESGRGFGKKDGGFHGQKDSELSGGNARDRNQSSSSSSDTLQYSDPPTEPEDAILIHIDDDGTFYLQLLSMEKDILFLTKRIGGSYKSGGPRLKESPVRGTVCCSKFADDGSMYRSRVENVKGNDVLVRYIDYGNVGQCSKNDLKFLFPDLMQYSIQAYPCQLKGFSWSLDKAELFGKATLDKDLKVTFTNTSPPFIVNIRTPDGDLLDVMAGKVTVSVNKPPPKSSFGGSKPSGFGGSSTSPNQGGGFGKKPNTGFGSSSPKQVSSSTDSHSPVKKALNFESVPVRKIPSQVFKDQSVPDGPQTAYISHISEDGYFYIQLDKDTEVLEKLTDKLVTLPGDTPHPSLATDASCGAIFSEDSSWYRAVILNQDVDKYKVSFVDFGNGDTVASSGIRPLTDELLQSPPLSYKCQFSECDPLPEDAQANLAQYLLEHQITVTFESKKVPFSVSAKAADGQNLQDVAFPTNKFCSQKVPNEVTPAGVSHIEEDGRFFIQLYKDYKAINELQSLLETAYSSADVETLSTPEKDTPCCVKSKEDEKWYRAKILDVTDSNVHVCHIDFGHRSTTSLEGLKFLSPNFVKRPPFAFECRLKGVDSWTEDLLAKFTEMTNEKILNATFYSTTLPCRVSLARSIELDLLGLKGPIIESPKKSSPADNTDARIPSDAFGKDAYITEVESEGHFYVQMASREEELQEFSGKLDASLESAEQPESVEEGQMLCAKFSEDEAWYRARVEKIEDEKYSVRFIDYGNTDCVGKEALAILPEDLDADHIAPFAFKADLACESKLTSELVEKLRILVTDKMVAVKSVSEISDVPRKVEMYIDGKDVVDVLDFKTSESVGNVDASTISHAFGEDAYITEVESEGHFYVQMASREEELQEFSGKLDASLESAEQPESVEEGQMLCAKFSEDEAWYRARVEKIEDEKYSVRFIDYGNTDCVGKEALAILPEDLDTDHIAPFAFKADLACESKLTSELVEKLRTLVTDKMVAVKVVSDIDDGLCMVQVHVDGKTVIDMLGLKISSAEAGELSSIHEICESALDINSNTMSEGERVSVTVSFVISPKKFFIQLEKDQPALDSLMDELYEYASGLPEGEGLVEDVKKGDLLAALYEDDSWYRVKVEAVCDDDSMQIFYIDHGNTEIMSDKSSFRHLPSKLKDVPVLLKEASLFGAKPIEPGWTVEAVQAFKAMVEGKTMIADILCQDKVPCFVQLLDMGTPVHMTLIDKGYGIATSTQVDFTAKRIFSDASESVLEEDSQIMDLNCFAKGKISCISQSLEELKQVEAFVSHCNSPSQFWCQLTSSMDTLDEISDSLQEAYSSQLCEEDKLKHDLISGDIVAAQFDVDKLYYRSLVLGSNSDDESGHKISVRFIDYGNCGSCAIDDVLNLRQSLSIYPIQAFRCSLDGIVPLSGSEWTAEACERISELIDEQDVSLKLVGKKQDGTCLVDLVKPEDGVSVAPVLVEENLAKFSVPSGADTLPSKLSQGGKDVSALEITQPIMESTAMINDTNSMMNETTSTMSNLSFEEVYDVHYKMFRLPLQNNYDVIVTDDELPHAFCVQIKEYRNQYKSLMSDIAKYIESDAATAASDWKIEVGEPCLVVYMDVWYRGLIRSTSKQGWMVKSVDCGWDVSVNETKIKEIPEQFMDLPLQALPCYLAGIVSVDADWTAEAIDFFSAFVRNRQMRIYVLETGDDGKYGVFMNDLGTSTSQSLNRAFVDKGFAEVVPGSYIDVTFDIEKTVNTEMLTDLEESFIEVGDERENDLDGKETEASSSNVDTFSKACSESYNDMSSVKATGDKNFYKLVQIQSASQNSEKMSQGQGDDPKDSQSLAKSVAFSIASAVDRIDELGCIDLFPDDTYPSFPNDLSSILGNHTASDMKSYDEVKLPADIKVEQGEKILVENVAQTEQKKNEIVNESAACKEDVTDGQAVVQCIPENCCPEDENLLDNCLSKVTTRSVKADSGIEEFSLSGNGLGSSGIQGSKMMMSNDLEYIEPLLGEDRHEQGNEEVLVVEDENEAPSFGSPNEILHTNCENDATSSDDSGQTLNGNMDGIDEEGEVMPKDVATGSELKESLQKLSFSGDGAVADVCTETGEENCNEAPLSLNNTLDEYESCSEVSDVDQRHESNIGDRCSKNGAEDTDYSETTHDHSFYETSSLLFTDSQVDTSLEDSSFQSYTSAYWDGASISSSSSNVADYTNDTSADISGLDANISNFTDSTGNTPADFSRSTFDHSTTTTDYTDSTCTDFSQSTVNESNVTNFTDFTDYSHSTDTSEISDISDFSVAFPAPKELIETQEQIKQKKAEKTDTEDGISNLKHLKSAVTTQTAAQHLINGNVSLSGQLKNPESPSHSLEPKNGFENLGKVSVLENEAKIATDDFSHPAGGVNASQPSTSAEEMRHITTKLANKLENCSPEHVMEAVDVAIKVENTSLDDREGSCSLTGAGMEEPSDKTDTLNDSKEDMEINVSESCPDGLEKEIDDNCSDGTQVEGPSTFVLKGQNECRPNETASQKAITAFKDFQDAESDPPSYHADDSDNDAVEKDKEEKAEDEQTEEQGGDTDVSDKVERADDSLVDASDTSFEEASEAVETKEGNGNNSGLEAAGKESSEECKADGNAVEETDATSTEVDHAVEAAQPDSDGDGIDTGVVDEDKAAGTSEEMTHDDNDANKEKPEVKCEEEDDDTGEGKFEASKEAANKEDA